jgi:osmotically-inducible protein OsmY
MFLDNELVAGKIKVVTVNGVVFMMGLLPREEADRAVEVARSVYGVQKIVKVFEYI